MKHCLLMAALKLFVSQRRPKPVYQEIEESMNLFHDRSNAITNCIELRRLRKHLRKKDFFQWILQRFKRIPCAKAFCFKKFPDELKTVQTIRNATILLVTLATETFTKKRFFQWILWRFKRIPCTKAFCFKKFPDELKNCSDNLKCHYSSRNALLSQWTSKRNEVAFASLDSCHSKYGISPSWAEASWFNITHHALTKSPIIPALSDRWGVTAFDLDNDEVIVASNQNVFIASLETLPLWNSLWIARQIDSNRLFVDTYSKDIHSSARSITMRSITYDMLDRSLIYTFTFFIKAPLKKLVPCHKYHISCTLDQTESYHGGIKK